MALNSNDRVTSNRLNYFASALWTKIKDTFSLNTHIHQKLKPILVQKTYGTDVWVDAIHFYNSHSDPFDGVLTVNVSVLSPSDTAYEDLTGELSFGVVATYNGTTVRYKPICKMVAPKDFSDKFDFKVAGDITDDEETGAIAFRTTLYIHYKGDYSSKDRLSFTVVNNSKDVFDKTLYTYDNDTPTIITVEPSGEYEENCSWEVSSVAERLSQGYGSTTQPIYIQADGTPAVCSSGGISVENATNAEYASNARAGSNLAAELNNVVHRTGSETIGGTKTFSNTIQANISGTSSYAKNAATGSTLATRLDGMVTLSTNQTISSTKTFSKTIVGNISGNAATADSATNATNATNATYASNAKSGSTLASQINNMVTLDGAQTISGAKTFSATITGNISGNAATATSAQNSTFTINSSGSGTGNCTVGGGSGSLALSSNASSGKGIWLSAHGTDTTGKWALVADTNNNVTLNGNASTASSVAWDGVTSKPNLHTGFQNTTNSGTLSNGGNFVTLSAFSNAGTSTPTFTSTTYTLPTCHNNFTAATGTPTTLSPGQSFIALTGITGSNTASPTFYTTSYTLPGNCSVVFDYVGSDLNTIYCL